MIAYKGFTQDLKARLGRGNYQFVPQKKHIDTEPSSKTVKSGFHCCENPFDCLSYYSLLSGDRFFQVHAEGNIDEDEYGRIACTEITLMQELTVKQFAGYGMMYMVEHPMRTKWQQDKDNVSVKADKANAERRCTIAIARGKKPKVKGVEGSILGMILEPENGNIVAAKLFTVGMESGTKENTWYTLTIKRELEELPSEKETD